MKQKYSKLARAPGYTRAGAGGLNPELEVEYHSSSETGSYKSCAESLVRQIVNSLLGFGS
jgi:hypothetical protein